MLATALVILLSAISGIFAIAGALGIFTKEFWEAPARGCLMALYILFNGALSFICIYSLLIAWSMVSYALYMFGAEILAGWVVFAIASWKEGIRAKDFLTLLKNLSGHQDTYHTIRAREGFVGQIRDEDIAELEKDVLASSNSLPVKIMAHSFPVVGRVAVVLGIMIVVALFWTFASSFGDLHAQISDESHIWSQIRISAAIVIAMIVGRFAIRAAIGKWPLPVKTSYVIGMTLYLVGLMTALYGVASAVVGWVPIKDGAVWSILVFGTAFVASDLGGTFMRPEVFPTAAEIRKSDRRPPVLYLRSFARESRSAMWIHLFRQLKSYVRFADDMGSWRILAAFKNARGSIVGPLTRRNLIQSFTSGRSMFDEQLVLANIMNRIGPYIAIARPGETEHWSDVGSAKEKVLDSDWKSVVLGLIKDSAAIVIEAGKSPNLLWEIRQVVAMVPGTKALLILAESERDYEQFCKLTGDIFQGRLPLIRPASRLITFTSDWRPITLPAPRFDEKSSLESLSFFIEQNTTPALKKPPE